MGHEIATLSVVKLSLSSSTLVLERLVDTVFLVLRKDTAGADKDQIVRNGSRRAPVARFPV